MPQRDRRPKTAKRPETPLMKKSAALTDEILKKLCSEKVFPKRSRWLISGKIADLANDYMTAIDEANRPVVQTAGLRTRRYELQQIALGKLEALSKKLDQAKRVLDIDPDTLENIAGLINDNEDLLHAWINSDLNRYGPPDNQQEKTANAQIVMLLSRCLELLERMAADEAV